MPMLVSSYPTVVVEFWMMFVMPAEVSSLPRSLTADAWATPGPRIDNAMAKGDRWGVSLALENGTYATIAEIAAAEKIHESYVGRALRLTLLVATSLSLGGVSLRATTRPRLAERKQCVRSDLECRPCDRMRTAAIVQPMPSIGC